MLEMLAEVIGAVEFLGAVAFAELVHVLQVSDALVPVRLGSMARRQSSTAASCIIPRAAARPRELIAAVTTSISLAWAGG